VPPLDERPDLVDDRVVDGADIVVDGPHAELRDAVERRLQERLGDLLRVHVQV
jgi:hypothetical protein